MDLIMYLKKEEVMNQTAEILGIIKSIFNYTDEQMDIIKSNPKYMQILAGESPHESDPSPLTFIFCPD